jgi:hypothetical protein
MFCGCVLRIIQIGRLNSITCEMCTDRLPHCVVFYVEESKLPSWLFRVKNCAWLLDEEPFAGLVT